MEKICRLIFLFIFILISFIFVSSDSVENANLPSFPTREEIIKLYRNAVVKVERYQIGGNEKDWSGSGVFYTKMRLITNAHVVGFLTNEFDDMELYSDLDLKRTIFWIVFNGKKYRAYMVGRDPELDLAILQTDNEIPDVKSAPLGNSDEIGVGDEVFAFGSPYGLDHSVTGGIISAKERITGLLSYENYLQTDAPINPGNSGGPLVRISNGRVVGIINSGISPADGMGFAIPINLFHKLEKDLRGTVKRSWLGINFSPQLINAEGFQGLSDIYSLTGINDIGLLQKISGEIFNQNKGGVLITDLVRISAESTYEKAIGKQDNLNRSPAYKAGLQVGDIIKKFGEYDIKKPNDLIFVILMAKPFEPVKLNLIRFDNKGIKREMTVEITPVLRLPSRSRGSY